MRALETQHHGIPRSFEGSDNEKTNVTDVKADEHDLFHQITGYVPPDALLRNYLLSTIGWHDTKMRMLAASFYDDMFAILTPSDWHSLYHPSSFHPGRNHLPKSQRGLSALHLYSTLGKEHRKIGNSIEYLGGSVDFVDVSTRNFQNTFCTFFRARNPVNAVESYINDANKNNEYKWTKPFLPETRRDIFAAINASKMENMTAHWRSRMIRILQNQKVRTEENQEIWDPVLDDYITDIAEHGQRHTLEAYRRLKIASKR